MSKSWHFISLHLSQQFHIARLTALQAAASNTSKNLTHPNLLLACAPSARLASWTVAPPSPAAAAAAAACGAR
jgi:hypothetical protein